MRHPSTDLAVDGDLHSGQVLRGDREQWLTVDPVLLRGDIAYDLGRMRWTRLDEMPAAGAIRAGFEAVVTAENPIRCDRLTRVFAT